MWYPSSISATYGLNRFPIFSVEDHRFVLFNQAHEMVCCSECLSFLNKQWQQLKMAISDSSQRLECEHLLDLVCGTHLRVARRRTSDYTILTYSVATAASTLKLCKLLYMHVCNSSWIDSTQTWSDLHCFVQIGNMERIGALAIFKYVQDVGI